MPHRVAKINKIALKSKNRADGPRGLLCPCGQQSLPERVCEPWPGPSSQPCPMSCLPHPHRFSDTCFLDTDGQATCDACAPGYTGRRCER